MARDKVLNPGDRVVLLNGSVGEVVCVHFQPGVPTHCDVRVPNVGLLHVANKDLERE